MKTGSSDYQYMNPYLAGIGLGIVLLAAFLIAGRGLGASGAEMRTVVKLEQAISQSHIDGNFYLSKYGGNGQNPWNNWLVVEALGVLVGGLLSGAWSGRLHVEIHHGPRINVKQRLFYAMLGGALFGFGARLARGCTSGHALTGGASMAFGSCVVLLCIFAGAYGLAWFVGKEWR